MFLPLDNLLLCLQLLPFLQCSSLLELTCPQCSSTHPFRHLSIPSLDNLLSCFIFLYFHYHYPKLYHHILTYIKFYLSYDKGNITRERTKAVMSAVAMFPGPTRVARIHKKQRMRSKKCVFGFPNKVLSYSKLVISSQYALSSVKRMQKYWT